MKTQLSLFVFVAATLLGSVRCHASLPFTEDSTIVCSAKSPTTAQNTESALRCLAHNPDVTARLLPDLNHLLLHCERGTQEEYAQLRAEKTSAEVLALLDTWIHQHLR